MQPDFSASLQFLRFIYPSGPWMLTAISVDKTKIEARTFNSDEGDMVVAWLELNKTRNLYYSVNEPVESAREKRKLSKTDVSRAWFLHVDVDPRAGEDVESEQRRIIAQIESYHIPPTVIVFSGGGYNALWRLLEPVPIAHGSPSVEETIARAVDFERRNWQFELDFATPDHCRDVSRILRLPGTINRPNAEKVAKGRTTALAQVVRLGAESYPLERFMATPHVSANAPTSKSRVAGDVVRTESLDQLKIPDRLKVIVAQGFDPEDPKRWEGDRSAALYYACCELVRHGMSDEIIMGLITDSRFLISASVLDKGAGTARYAMRQVQRARDNADHPMLAEMNQQFAVILNYGQSPAILVENGRLNVQTGRHEPVFQSFKAFRDRIKNLPSVNVEVAGKMKSITAFEWWTAHPRRRTFDDVTFEPGLDTPRSYNLWTGFAVTPIAGGRHERLLRHVRENICKGVSERYEYLIKWMARVVQQPRTQSMVAPVLLGERGTGKSVFANFFGSIFTPHWYTASDIEQLTGKFNAHLGSCVFVLAEEAFDLRDKRHESVLKDRITGRVISIERKTVDVVQMPSYVHLMMTSNNERVVPAGDKERRFFVIRVGENHIQDSAYFMEILEDQRCGGLSHLLHYLLSIDLSNYDVTKVPRTEELRLQQEHNLSLELDWLMGKLETGVWLPGGRVPWQGPVRKKLLHEDYRQQMAAQNARYIKGERAFHRFIMESLPGTRDKQMETKEYHDRPMVFLFPTLSECRERFDERRGWVSRWRDVPDDPEDRGDPQGEIM